jgi:hypothetical protein
MLKLTKIFVAVAFIGVPTLAFADGDSAVTGAAGGAVAGAVVGGPVGAVVGGAAGAVIGGGAHPDHERVVERRSDCATRTTTTTNNMGDSSTTRQTDCR